jgi:PAS domain S-box-containing protein
MSDASPGAPPTNSEPEPLPQADSGAGPQQAAGQPFLARLLEKLPYPVSYVDADLVYRQCNAAAAATVGRTRDQIVGRTVASVVGADSEVVTLLRGVLESGEPYSGTLEFTPRGSARTTQYRVSYVPDTDDEGRTVGVITNVVDISDLLESEERFAAVFEKSPFALALTKMPGATLVAVNSAFEVLFGFERDEVLGKTSPDLGISDAGSQAQILEQVARHGFCHDFVCTRRTRGGDEIWLSLSVDRLSLAGEEYLLTTVQDINDRRRAEEALRDSEERFRVLFEGHRAVMLLIEPDSGQILDANAAAARFYGYSREQMQAMRIQQINQLPPDEVAAERRRAAGGGDELFSFPHRLASGEVRIVEVYSTPVEIQGRRTLFSIIHDVTARKQAEEALEQTRGTLAEAQEIAHVGSFEYVAATRTTHWSAEEYRIYGLDPAGPSPAYAVMLAKCIHPDDAARLHETFTKAVQSGSVYELEHRIVRPDGSVRWVYDRARPYFDDDGGLLRYVGATQDITERKLAEDALRESEAERAAHEERARLARDLHDSVTQALFAATLKAEALTLADGPVPSGTTQVAEEVRRLNRGALAQMRTLLLELRGDPLEEVPIGQLLRRLVEAAEGRAGVDVRLTIRGQAQLPPALHVAVYRITQEALSNVTRHAGASKAWVDIDMEPHAVHLVVGDDGHGFELSDFDPTHMGLRSMRERASEAGARLEVVTELGGGTVIEVHWQRDRPVRH